MQTDQATIEIQQDPDKIRCVGVWTNQNVADLPARLQSLPLKDKTELTIDGSGIVQLDTAGAWLLNTLVRSLTKQGIQTRFSGFDAEKTRLIKLLQQQDIHTAVPPVKKRLTWLANVGRHTCLNLRHSNIILAFIGRVAHSLARIIYCPKSIQWRALLQIIEQNGYHALAIIALLSYLIGVVLAYQMGTQLKNYGANVYVVDLLGLSILREFGPLITAIIVAGRTGAAYTAEIGTMKVHEEIDALSTMGISPMEILTIPRILGLVISLPLLTIWADLFGLLGGMVMSKNLLDISFHNFLVRFDHVVSWYTYYTGLIKTPVFALLIAGVGCYHGFQVHGGADSVGRETTKSVVHAIFLIIVADAIFSVIFGWKKL